MRNIARVAAIAAIFTVFGGIAASSAIAEDKPAEKNSPARDAGETAREAWESGKGVARETWDTSRDAARKAWQSTRDFFRGAWTSGKQATEEVREDLKDGWKDPEKRR